MGVHITEILIVKNNLLLRGKECYLSCDSTEDYRSVEQGICRLGGPVGKTQGQHESVVLQCKCVLRYTRQHSGYTLHRTVRKHVNSTDQTEARQGPGTEGRVTHFISLCLVAESLKLLNSSPALIS